eukprot:365856-Chlamydomonas_euryale.AAC.4
MALPTFKPSGKELLVTNSFQYLGSFFVDDGSMSREMDVQILRALAAFCQFPRHMSQPQAEQASKKWMRIAHLFCPFSCTAAKRGHGG